MQFLYQPLTWGFLLVAVPLLIHLINLTRQRRIRWAAMEFLLAANKKHRRWIWLRQFLLLASRMLAVAMAVAMLAHLVTRNQWTQLLGGSTTHHIVILDDTMSMSDQLGVATPFQRAESVVMRLADQLASADWGQKLSLIRVSQASRIPSDSVAADPLATATQVADFFGVSVDDQFSKRMEQLPTTMDVSPLAVWPTQALQLVVQLVDTLEKERPIVYLVSDFREETWGRPAELLTQIAELEKLGATVNLVRCAEEQHANLALTDIRPSSGTRAAGVPLFVEVEVTNYGEQPVEQIPLTIETTYFGNDAVIDDPVATHAEASELPSILIDRIDPGGTVSRRVQVYFPTAGQHVVTARLPADSLQEDNERWCIISMPPDIPVAVIDGDPARRNAIYLTSVFQPSQRVQTGVRPVEVPVSFLQMSTEDQLDEFPVIYLLDVSTLDAKSITNLENYVRRGGGVAVFVGPQVSTSFYRQWHDQGNFPVPLHRLDVSSPILDGSGALVVEDHPVFRVLLGEGNPFASQVRIQQFIRPIPNWEPDSQSATRILARLADGQPLAVERSLGDGKLVVFLTTLAPIWNTWAMQPSFVVVLLELQVYLNRQSLPAKSLVVGTPIDVDIDTAVKQRDVIFVIPDVNGERQTLRRQSTPLTSSAPALQRATLGVDVRDQLIGRTDRPGFYEAWQRGITGELTVKRYAMNVNTRESDLQLVEDEQLADALAGTQTRIFAADELTIGSEDGRGVPWSEYLMWGLLGLLLLEQAMAYFTSYHPRTLKGISP